MKRFIIAAALTCACVFGAAGGALAADAKPVLGVVNMTKLYTESKAGKDAMAWLEAIQTEAFAKMEAMQADLTKAQEAKDQPTVDRLQVEVQAMAYTLQNLLTKEQERVVAVVTAGLNDTTEQYRAAHNLVAVLSAESLQVYDPKAEITSEIMALSDKKPLDFGKKPSLELPPATPVPAAPVAAEPAK